MEKKGFSIFHLYLHYNTESKNCVQSFRSSIYPAVNNTDLYIIAIYIKHVKKRSS